MADPPAVVATINGPKRVQETAPAGPTRDNAHGAREPLTFFHRACTQVVVEPAVTRGWLTWGSARWRCFVERMW